MPHPGWEGVIVASVIGITLFLYIGLILFVIALW